MFHIEFFELLLLAFVGLLVLDPKRLLTVAVRLCGWLGSARRTVTELHRQLERETGFKAVAERPRPKLRIVPRDPRHAVRAGERRSP